MQNTKQIILSASLIAVFILFVIYEKQNADSSANAFVAPLAQGTPTAIDKTPSVTPAVPPATPTKPYIPAPTPTQVAIKPSPAAPAPVPAPTPRVAKYQDGTFTGKVADAYFGNLQVATVINSGKITDVKFLEYPNDQPESLQISNRTMPKLKSEAISSQSEKVDIISGATQTCEAFNESLADALLQAKA